MLSPDVKIFDAIRQYFGNETGYDAADFSFNSKGSCPACNGVGYTVTDIHFIGDIKTPCEICGGKRYRQEILNLEVRGKNISKVLDMTVAKAMDYFKRVSEIYGKLEILDILGLEYFTLGQPLLTLSGGELQRLKLADRLKKRGQVYIFDEPTHGLHFKDTERIVGVINKLVDTNNIILAIGCKSKRQKSLIIYWMVDSNQLPLWNVCCDNLIYDKELIVTIKNTERKVVGVIKRFAMFKPA